MQKEIDSDNSGVYEFDGDFGNQTNGSGIQTPNGTLYPDGSFVDNQGNKYNCDPRDYDILEEGIGLIPISFSDDYLALRNKLNQAWADKIDFEDEIKELNEEIDLINEFIIKLEYLKPYYDWSNDTYDKDSLIISIFSTLLSVGSGDINNNQAVAMNLCLSLGIDYDGVFTPSDRRSLSIIINGLEDEIKKKEKEISNIEYQMNERKDLVYLNPSYIIQETQQKIDENYALEDYWYKKMNDGGGQGIYPAD